MNQLPLPIPSDFEMITMAQLLTEHPNLKDSAGLAREMVKRWDDKRAKLGLTKWK